MGANLRLPALGPKVSEAVRNTLDLRGGDTAQYAQPIVVPTAIVNLQTDPIPVGYPRPSRNQIPFWLKISSVAAGAAVLDNYSTDSPVTTLDTTVPPNKILRITSYSFTSNAANAEGITIYDTGGAGTTEAEIVVQHITNATGATNFSVLENTALFFTAGQHLRLNCTSAAPTATRAFITGFFEDA